LALNDGVSQTHILNNHIKKCTICIPLSKSEQESVGKTLSAIDKELSALELKLEKAKSIKFGMMQQLLTGKIRLI
jgi:type I restriction enzyme S subunit